MKLYVGTYTRPAPYLAETNGKGLYVLDYDEASGAVTIDQEVPGIENPSYLCISPDGRNLHAVWEVVEWPEGLVSSYAIDPSSGQLSYLGVQGSRGTVTCYAMLDTQSRAAVIANYWSGTVAMFPARADGSLAEASDVDQHEGTGPNEARQEGPHAHSIVISDDDRFAFSADLGTDSIYGYSLDYERMAMQRVSELKLPAGAGPRHFVFAPSGQHAYVICELDSSIAALGHDAATGELRYIDSVPLLPADFEGESHCADIQVHPSGRFVYGSNRGHDSVTMFAVDADSGKLELIGHRSTEGATPRNLAISPDGRYLLVANQDSDNIVTMPIDPVTGELGDTAAVAEVPTPVCLKFGR
jgi:6-phosphogluconolactonase